MHVCLIFGDSVDIDYKIEGKFFFYLVHLVEMMAKVSEYSKRYFIGKKD